MVRLVAFGWFVGDFWWLGWWLLVVWWLGWWLLVVRLVAFGGQVDGVW